MPTPESSAADERWIYREVIYTSAAFFLPASRFCQSGVDYS
jgi:hypothetical protein